MKKAVVLLTIAAMIVAVSACSTGENVGSNKFQEDETASFVENSINEEDSYVEDVNDDGNLADGMRVEFKSAMDDYEAFYDEYCEFMNKYKANPTDLTLLGEYSDMLQRLEDMDEAFDEWENDDLNTAELKYYLEVNSRVLQKLADAAK